ncbi:hypothetical protein J2Z18_002903 [Paenibacillus lactis]|uniref:Uncharacterized protein n=2 Tax=Paenibacillus lactis TaxID=228574 RepID=G4HC16_9BACL|nr:hypothetical protein PaelaDRAFT_0921 [Paenibacillus lactis 154]MBP1893800.1 hypothetical protein [Paenibacillus lactis]
MVSSEQDHIGSEVSYIKCLLVNRGIHFIKYKIP